MHLVLLPNLRTIYLNNNYLTEFPNFQPCPKMEIIDMSSNRISQDITEQLKELKFITELRVNFNKLSDFPNFTQIWPTNGSLRVLGLLITTIPRSCYSSLINLNTFDIGGNNLVEVPIVLNISFKNLATLNISDNKIQR